MYLYSFGSDSIRKKKRIANIILKASLFWRKKIRFFCTLSSALPLSLYINYDVMYPFHVAIQAIALSLTYLLASQNDIQHHGFQ